MQLLLLLAISLLIGSFFIISGNPKLQLQLSEDNNISILLNSNYKQQTIYPWYNESDDRYYVFLPAYCKSNFVRFNGIGADKIVFLNGNSVHSGSKFKWQEEAIYQLEILSENADTDYDITFVHSENLPSLFIETDSGSMEYIHKNKENEEEGNIDIITADGNTEYSGKLSKISGRGNSTWDLAKKPYSLKLADNKPLLGMDAADKWCLLSGWREGAKMNSKLAFDIAEILHLDYSPQCTWIDLYLNGEYAGIYLLTESVSVGDGRVEITDLEKQNKIENPNIEQADTFEENGMKGYIINNGGNISGGYLFEKDFADYWANSAAGFTTSRNNTFTINSPQHASREQVEYLAGHIQNIDDMINDGNTEYRNYVDFESFARKFIVDEIALSHDVNITSMFYYKKKNDDLIYAGPIWDFDGAFGEGNSGWLEGVWVNYEYSSIYPFRSEEDTLNWYTKLYDDEEFRTRVIEIYSGILPEIEELLNTRIDLYADYIRKSAALDNTRWGYVDTRGDDNPGHYIDFNNNVRYLKFFLAKRINYLNERWDVDYADLPLPNTGDTHEITFWMDGEIIETRKVADGELLSELPSLDENAFWGWYFTHSNEKYRAQLPIFEDTSFYARRKED